MLKDAKWIWNQQTTAPRNCWNYFRSAFELPLYISDHSASIHITAHSRYVLFVNGVRIGTGPMKCFQEHIPYDTYDITKHLRSEKNIIGVLGHYAGVGTMQERFGEAGIIMSCDIRCGTDSFSIVSDDHFMTKECVAMDYHSPRSCVQQSFTEHMDARLWENFSSPDYQADAGWSHACVVNRSLDCLYERDIPLLTQIPIAPVRVNRLRAVSPPQKTFVVDTRCLLLEKEGHQNCNPVTIEGVVLTTIAMKQAGELTLFLDVARCNPLCIDGKWYQQRDLSGHKELSLTVTLEQGNHLLAFDISDREHWKGVHFGLFSDCAYDVLPPLNTNAETPFLLMGPFSPSCYSADTVPDLTHADAQIAYHCLLSNVSIEALQSLSAYQREIPDYLVSDCDPLLLFANARSTEPFVTEYSVPQTMQSIVIEDNHSTVIPLFDQNDTEFIVDFGKEVVGFLDFEVEAPAGTVLDFYSYEWSEEGIIQHTWGYDSVWRYVCKEGRQSVTSFLRRGFRYCAVAVRQCTAPPKFYHIKLLESTYPLPRIGSFSCSDRLLSDIWEISAHTVQLCSEDTFVDCPAYEQVFWVGDSRNETLISHYVYGNTQNIKRSLELVPLSSLQSPLLCSHVPSMWDSVIPNWSFSWIIACAEYYDYTGDVTFVEENISAICNCLDGFLAHINKRGLLDITAWNLLDWAEIDQPNDGIVTHQNMFMAKALSEVIGLLCVLGRDTAAYKASLDRLKSSINEHLWDQANGVYFDCIHADGEYSTIYSVQTQICALLCDIPSSQQQNERVSQAIYHPPAAFVRVGSPFMAFFMYEVFEKTGHIQTLYEDIKENFGNMIQHGATTCWEQYPQSPLNKVYDGMLSRSHCHAWSAAPAYFLSRHILGIKPLSVGWERIVIEPQPFTVTWANGSVPHPRGGTIDVAYSVNRGVMELYVSVPADVTVQIVTPAHLKCNTVLKTKANF